MQSLANGFRASVRHAPQLRQRTLASVPTFVRMFASSSSWLRAENASVSTSGTTQEMSDAFRDFTSQASRSEPTVATPEVAYKGFDDSDFIQPIDLSRGARIKAAVRRPKRWSLGPGRAESEKNDIFRQLDIDPLHESLNSVLLSSYVTEMGKIRKRSETNLTWKSQRRLGKAIRRAKQMGIIPLYSQRPLNPAAVYLNSKTRPTLF